METYTDADWGSGKDKVSYSGYVSMYGGGAISWSSRKQRVVAGSTVESEFIALNESSKECAWMRHLLEELEFHEMVEQPTTIWIDNQGAQNLAENHVTSERSKHIEVPVFLVRKEIENGVVQTKYVKTEDKAADILTKIVSRPKMEHHLATLGLRDKGEC